MLPNSIVTTSLVVTILAFCTKNGRDAIIARWALALQEFDFKVEYKPGSQNGNADVLSRRDSLSTESSPCAATFLQPDPTQNALCVAQWEDAVISQLYQHLSMAKPPSTSYSTINQTVVNRYGQFWWQLNLISGIVCQCYRPHPADAIVTVPVFPLSYVPKLSFRLIMLQVLAI